MKLYIIQRFLSLNDSFQVLDENEQVKYNVEGKIFSLGRKFSIYNLNGKEVSRVEQEIFRIFPKFNVYIEDKKLLDIEKRLSFFKQVYEIEGLDWIIEGDITSHEYEIKQGTNLVASISKKWFKLTDTYEIDIKEDKDEIVALAVVLSIDAVLAMNKR